MSKLAIRYLKDRMMIMHNGFHNEPYTPEIKFRKINFDFNHAIPKYWYGNTPFKTYLADAILSTFAIGERELFIYSVQQVKNRIHDDTLLEETQAFIAQEAAHGKQHRLYNKYLQQNYGHQFDQWDTQLSQFIRFHWRLFSNKNLLAMTVCLEHITACIGNLTLSRTIFTDANKHIMPFLQWHALEELEHKSVCFDIYNHLNYGYFRRVMFMPYVLLVMLMPVTWSRIVAMMWQDKQLFKLKIWYQGFKYLIFSKEGLRSLLNRRFFAYFKPSFHPWQDHSDQNLIEQYALQFEAFVKEPS